ncbi:MAG TPA: haloacid dehalogenase type II [Fimbriimonas sp.]|nr:haloacid dehalogenase type II [Fimbriimonas sp.]
MAIQLAAALLLITPTGPRFKAVAFDYFVLFDPNSVAVEVENAFPARGTEFTRIWRSKQFEYCYLRSITHRYEDFYRITADAFDYTAEALHLRPSPELRRRLVNSYLAMRPWPDTVSALKRLKSAGVKIVTIANFSPMMLRANADHAGITRFIDKLLSTEANRSYKPDEAAYGLAMSSLHLRKSEIAFAAFGGWDAYGAKSFGYATCWVNRFGVPAERLGILPDRESRDLAGLLELVLGHR